MDNLFRSRGAFHIRNLVLYGGHTFCAQYIWLRGTQPCWHTSFQCSLNS